MSKDIQKEVYNFYYNYTTLFPKVSYINSACYMSLITAYYPKMSDNDFKNLIEILAYTYEYAQIHNRDVYKLSFNISDPSKVIFLDFEDFILKSAYTFLTETTPGSFVRFKEGTQAGSYAATGLKDIIKITTFCHKLEEYFSNKDFYKNINFSKYPKFINYLITKSDLIRPTNNEIYQIISEDLKAFPNSVNKHGIEIGLALAQMECLTPDLTNISTDVINRFRNNEYFIRKVSTKDIARSKVVQEAKLLKMKTMQYNDPDWIYFANEKGIFIKEIMLFLMDKTYWPFFINTYKNLNVFIEASEK